MNKAIEELRACVQYCREQNGMDACKNCGLSDSIIDAALKSQAEEVVGLISKQMSIHQELAGQWTGINITGSICE